MPCIHPQTHYHIISKLVPVHTLRENFPRYRRFPRSLMVLRYSRTYSLMGIVSSLCVYVLQTVFRHQFSLLSWRALFTFGYHHTVCLYKLFSGDGTSMVIEPEQLITWYSGGYSWTLFTLCLGERAIKQHSRNLANVGDGCLLKSWWILTITHANKTN